jgi:hypothetical protein
VASAFLSQQGFEKVMHCVSCVVSETLTPGLLTLSSGYSIKAKAWVYHVHDGWTTELAEPAGHSVP